VTDDGKGAPRGNVVLKFKIGHKSGGRVLEARILA
jgi:hypothetical protein